MLNHKHLQIFWYFCSVLTSDPYIYPPFKIINATFDYLWTVFLRLVYFFDFCQKKSVPYPWFELSSRAIKVDPNVYFNKATFHHIYDIKDHSCSRERCTCMTKKLRSQIRSIAIHTAYMIRLDNDMSLILWISWMMISNIFLFLVTTIMWFQRFLCRKIFGINVFLPLKTFRVAKENRIQCCTHSCYPFTTRSKPLGYDF